jgi:hypothetical protein
MCMFLFGGRASCRDIVLKLTDSLAGHATR